jgi:hypothetical protein
MNSHAVRCCADARPWMERAPVGIPGTPVNLVAGLAHGACHDDICMEQGAGGQGGTGCTLTTNNRNGGGKPGVNGIRRCGKTSQSTLGWGGEPGRAIDGKKCTAYGDGSCSPGRVCHQAPISI